MNQLLDIRRNEHMLLRLYQHHVSPDYIAVYRITPFPTKFAYKLLPNEERDQDNSTDYLKALILIYLQMFSYYFCI